MEVNRVNDRIVSVTVILEDRPYKLISAYCSQSQLTEDMKIQFYDALECELLTTDNPLVGGDFNGHIGEDNSSCESVHGGFGYGSQNRDGVRLLDCTMSARLFIANTAFKKPHTQLVTFMSGRNATQIDYILNRKGSISLKNAKTFPVGTQHKLVVADFTMKKVHKQRKVKRQPRIKTWNLRDSETKKLFTTEFAAIPEATTWEKMSAVFLEDMQPHVKLGGRTKK